MPFKVVKVKPDKQGRRWAVKRVDTGKIKSRHFSAAKAGASMGYAERGSKDLPKKHPLHGLI